MTNTFAPFFAYDNYLAPEFDIVPNEERAFEMISERERRTASLINVKENAQYNLFEIQTCQQWFTNFNVSNSTLPLYGFRIVVNLGTLPNTATLTVPHGISQLQPTAFFTQVQGFAVNPTAVGGAPKYIQFPYASPTAADNIEIYADDTNVYVITGKDQTAFTRAYAVLEYVKFSN